MDIRSMKIMDLHNHTKMSDGAHSIEEIIENSIEGKVSTIGISDHFHTTKCNSVSIHELNDYIQRLNRLKEEYRDRIEVLSAVEICLDRAWSNLETLPYEQLNKLDYVLLEYVDNWPTCVKLDELKNFTKNFTCRVGLAHTDPFKLIEKYGFDKVIKVLKENNVFWEINIDEGYGYFDYIKNKIDDDDVLNWFKKLKDNGIDITVGSDTHNLINYDIERIKLANNLAKH